MRTDIPWHSVHYIGTFRYSRQREGLFDGKRVPIAELGFDWPVGLRRRIGVDLPYLYFYGIGILPRLVSGYKDTPVIQRACPGV